MGRCLKCERKGFFLKVNEAGLCKECALEEEQQKAAEHEAALAEAILRVWSDKALYAELCEGARRVFYEKFTSGVMTRRLEAVYAAEAERIRADGKA